MLHLSSTLSKLLKRRFGKGPETCYVNGDEERLIIFMRNFVTPAEEVLLGNNEYEIAISFRNAIINSVIKEFKPVIKKTLGRTFANAYYDWSYDNNTGMILLDNGHAEYEEKLSIGLKNIIFSMIDSIGSRLHKRPQQLKLVKYTPTICMIETHGVLAQLETLVYKSGNINLLYRYSNSIKEGYLQHKKEFEETFNRNIEDIFIIWDYQQDRSLLVFTFRKEF